MKNEFNSGILVAGVTRNCALTINEEIYALQNAFKSFSEIHWLIIESDSSDDTQGELTKLESQIKNFRFISLGNLQEKLPLRTERIAYCRNKYLEELETNSIYINLKWVAVVDLDGVNNNITTAAVDSSWSNDNWDACTANQSTAYYDIWALRHPIWSPNDCWDQYEFLKSHNTSRSRALNSAVYSKMITIAQNSKWIEVESAFGGLAIYKKIALLNSRYIGVKPEGKEICEHVELHRQLREKGYKIFINPQLINTGYTEHSNHIKYIPRIKKRLKSLLAAILQHLSFKEKD